MDVVKTVLGETKVPENIGVLVKKLLNSLEGELRLLDCKDCEDHFLLEIEYMGGGPAVTYSVSERGVTKVKERTYCQRCGQPSGLPDAMISCDWCGAGNG